MYEAFKPLGALSIGIAWLSVLFLVLNWRGDRTMSFSKRAAAHKGAYLTMAIMESIFLPMYLVFLGTWFRYTFDLPLLFTILSGVSVIGLLIAAWVPDVADVRGKIHMSVVYPAYSCMILSTLFIVTSGNISTFARLFSSAAFCYMVAGSFYLVRAKSRNNFLYIQGAFLASVHLSVLFATYIR